MISSVPDDIAPVQPHDHTMLAGPAEPGPWYRCSARMISPRGCGGIAGRPADWVSRVRLDPEGTLV